MLFALIISLEWRDVSIVKFFWVEVVFWVARSLEVHLVILPQQIAGNIRCVHIVLLLGQDLHQDVGVGWLFQDLLGCVVKRKDAVSTITWLDFWQDGTLIVAERKLLHFHFLMCFAYDFWSTARHFDFIGQVGVLSADLRDDRSVLAQIFFDSLPSKTFMLQLKRRVGHVVLSMTSDKKLFVTVCCDLTS
jgi:hypothetical protein